MSGSKRGVLFVGLGLLVTSVGCGDHDKKNNNPAATAAPATSSSAGTSGSNTTPASGTAPTGSGTTPAAPGTPPPALAIQTTQLPDAILNVAYQTTLQATGGTQPYTWRIAAGRLPAGLTLDSSGLISGTPTEGGPFTFTSEVEAGGTAAQQALTLQVLYLYEVGAGQRFTTLGDALAAADADLGGTPFPATVEVVVHDGTYPELLRVPTGLQPTASERLVIRAAAGAAPVIDGQNLRNAADLRDAKHLTLSGLGFNNGREFGVILWGNTEDNVFERCSFFQNSRSGVECWEYNTDLTVQNCIFSGNGFGGLANGQRSGIGLNGWASVNGSVVTGTITNVEIVNNTFFDNANNHVYEYNAAAGYRSNIYDGVNGGQGLGSPAEGNFLFGMGDPRFHNPSTDPAVADFHLQSTTGRYDGGTWATDPVSSPCIDLGDPAAPVGAEPTPNGGRINAGAYGGTAEASKS